MSKIKICALGGLNETGKNMYLVQVDSDIFVFDCGLKYDHSNFGVDYIIPDFTYLKQNIKKIKGIFLTHGHDESMGAIPNLIKEVPNVAIYGTKYTMIALKRKLEAYNIKKANLREILPNKKINFGKNSIFTLNVSHSVPDAICFILNTKDGSIVYTGNYTFDFAMDGNFKTDLGKLAYIGKQNVLCLLGESNYAGRRGHTSPKHRIAYRVKNILRKHSGRIIFNTYSSQLFRIKEILDEITKTNRLVVVMGKNLQNTINDGINNGYLEFDQKRIGDLSHISHPNVVLLVANELENPFHNMNRIVKGYDKYIKITEDDMIVFTEPYFDGTELIEVNLANEIAKIGAEVIVMSNKDSLLHHASQEDIKLMVNLMDPKYYMPVSGEYRLQVMNADAASGSGFNEKNIILKLNGEVVLIENGVLKETKEQIRCEDVSIDGKGTLDVSDLVIRDRDILGNNGVVIVTTTIKRQDKTLLHGPEINTRGFIYVKDNVDLIKDLQEVAKEIVEKEIADAKVDYHEIKKRLRDGLSKFIYNETECRPMIISVILEV